MGKQGVKDPSPTTASKALSAVFNPVVFGGTGAAIAAKWGTKHLVKLLPVEVPQWQATGATALLGFSAGAWSLVVAKALRRRLIKKLLTYKGFMFHPKSTKTKLWGLALATLVGPGPHHLYDFQPLLPKLPLPELEESLKRYLEIVEPLLTEEEFKDTKAAVELFQKNEGKTLQKFLRKKSKKMRSWLADWWLTTNYLMPRDSIAINVNFFMTSTVVPEVSNNSLARSANCLEAVTKYYEMIQNKTLPPDMVMGMIPTCMDGVNYMFGACRIPGEHVDTLVTFNNSRHCVIMSKGVYYRMEMYAKDEQGQLKRLSRPEIIQQLKYIEKETENVEKINAVAALTSQRRDVWARHRAKLLQNKVNAATLKNIEESIFLIVLGDSNPENMSQQGKSGLAGNGYNRWFDKGLTLENFLNCTKGACNMEHSGADATHFSVMWEHCLQEEEYGPDGDIIIKRGEKCRPLPPPTRLEWQFDAEMQANITQAYKAYKQRVEDLDMLMMPTDFGKKWMKQSKVSPDGFLQMAIQLAYFRLHGHFTKTYEPASHRLFDQGRTDNINPVSKASIHFVHTMDDATATRDQKITALTDAIGHQSRSRLECTAGRGCERHLLGLQCAASALGMDPPPIFTDKAYQLPMRLSTSQVPTILGHLDVPLLPESIGGGFGPPCHDGYGLLYCSIGESMFNFSITSWHNCPETDSTEFAAEIKRAMRDMRYVIENKPPSS